MQNKTARFLWIILLGTVTVIEAVPDSPAVIHRHGNALPAPSPKQFLARAASLKTNVGRGAATLLRGAREKAQTLRPTRKHSSPEKVENPRNSTLPIPTSAVLPRGECYANLPPSTPPSDYLDFDAWTQQQVQVDPPTLARQESDYLKLHDLNIQGSPNPSPYGWLSHQTEAYANIPDEVQMDSAEKLRHALNIGDVEGAQQLIEAGADPNERSENNGTTLLYIATQSGNEELAQWLLQEKRADATIANRSGRTALHQAALFGRIVIASLLVESGGDVDATDTTSKTPIDFARQRNNRELVDILLAAKEKRDALK